MYYFLVNPSSSSGKSLRVWEKAQAHLKKRGAVYETVLLERPGMAREIAEKLCSQKTPCTVTVVGGDGTINEFVSGLTDYSHITFATLPTGSGNDFARGLRLPASVEACTDMILDGKAVRPVNICVTESGRKKSCFVVSSGFGYDAMACYAADRSPMKKALNRIHLGKMVYLVNALLLLVRIRPVPMRFRTDNGSELTFRKVFFTAAMNTPFEGGGFMFCPEADPGDDRLDLIIAENIPKWKILFMLPLALSGKHTGCRGIHILKCRRIDILSARDACVHVDGEHFGFARRVTFSLLPEKIRMISGL